MTHRLVDGTVNVIAPMWARVARVQLNGLALVALACLGFGARADNVNFHLNRDAFGEVGILDMPSAYMADDGQVSMTGGLIGANTQRVNFTFQVLPWFEGTFRYSHLSGFGTTGNYYDRSLGMRLRFWDESRYIPAFSMGIRDLLGTGVYGSEYFVASKHFGPVDVSAGLGWGRLSDNSTFDNPFGLIFQSFNIRPPFTGKGGQVNFSQFFHGPKTGVFGGAIWHTPVENLDLLVEYSSDEYKREVASGNMSWRAPVNVGLAYSPFDSMRISAAWMYGTTWGANLTFTTDPKQSLFPVKIDAPPIPANVREGKQQADAYSLLTQVAERSAPLPHAALRQALMSELPNVRDIAVSNDKLAVILATQKSESAQCSVFARLARQIEPQLRQVTIVVSDEIVDSCLVEAVETRDASPPLETTIRQHARKQGVAIDAISIGEFEATVYYRNVRYFSEDEAVGRLARVLMADAPPGVEMFRLVVDQHGVPIRQFLLSRSDLERSARQYGTADDFKSEVTTSRPPMKNPVLDDAAGDIYPRVSWSILPGFRQSLFDPNSPYQVQFLAKGAASVDLWTGVTADTKLDLNLWNNFLTNRISNSQLPHVRSDIAQYLKFGASGINTLALNYRTRFAPTVFAKFTVGYMEDMFAGAGGQILWRPEQSRISVGIDAYEVWQRGFDRLLDLRGYHVATGHISLYYESPWMGLNFNVHAGRYLAGDYGATFEVLRRFSSGVEIGAYATFTNVPFSKFGEGSFDKGVILHLPLEWGLPVHSSSVYDATLRSLSRDGGQRLFNDDSLADETARSSDGDIYENLNDIANP